MIYLLQNESEFFSTFHVIYITCDKVSKYYKSVSQSKIYTWFQYFIIYELDFFCAVMSRKTWNLNSSQILILVYGTGM